jgi:hypothetical protein
MKIAMLAIIGALLSPLAQADEAVRVERGKGGHRRYVILKPLEVHANAPQPFILLNRAEVQYQAPDLELPLAARIHQATTHDPF